MCIRFFIVSLPSLVVGLATLGIKSAMVKRFYFGTLAFLDNIWDNKTNCLHKPSTVFHNHYTDNQGLAWFVCQKFGVYNLPCRTICLSVTSLSRSAFVTGLSCQSASLICLFSVRHLSATFVKRGSLAMSG